MAVPNTKLIALNPQIITDHQIDTDNQINLCRDHARALSPDPFCLRSFEGRCQKHIAINLKLAARALRRLHSGPAACSAVTLIDKLTNWRLCFAVSEKPFAFRSSVYRLDVNAGDSMVVAEERYNTIAEMLSLPYQPDEEYLILFHGLRRRRWLSREEIQVWASQQETDWARQAHAGRGVPNRSQHCQAAKRAAADIEGYSAAAKFG
jgi:hypothetical protein